MTDAVPAVESYTEVELDEVAGSLLFVGGLHTALGLVLDVTSDDANLELVEFVNHLPAAPAAGLLATLVMAVAEVQARLSDLAGAAEAAMDSTAKRILGDQSKASEEFDKIMAAEFKEQAEKDGLA